MAYTTIDNPTDYFNTKLYTGTGSSNSLTGVGFQPDWTWIKQRSTTGGHRVYDVIRGATDTLYTNQNYASAVESQTLTSFNSDGFTVGTDSGVNGSGVTFVAWNWDANGAGVSNTAGTISSTVSANTTSGFSVVGYTGNGTGGATVGHGLGVVPKMFIIKERTDLNPWVVYHASVDVTGEYTLRLDETSAKTNANATNNNTAPTSSLITLGISSLTNGSSKTYIAYCFAEVKGYSKFGSYTGNGSTDGTFVYTGFKPAFVMIKRTDSTSDWVIFDNKRNTFNLVNAYLRANTSNAEAVDAGGSGSWFIDFLSNGFKLKENSSGINASGGTFIYMAFAENPFVSSTGIPTTAR